MNDMCPPKTWYLQPQDSLHIFSLSKLIDIPQVSISGQVRNTGQYDSAGEHDHHRSCCTREGGLPTLNSMKGVFRDRADLFRVSADGRSEEIIPFHLGDALSGERGGEQVAASW